MQTKPDKSLSIIIWMNISQLDYNLIKTDTEFMAILYTFTLYPEYSIFHVEPLHSVSPMCSCHELGKILWGHGKILLDLCKILEDHGKISQDFW